MLHGIIIGILITWFSLSICTIVMFCRHVWGTSSGLASSIVGIILLFLGPMFALQLFKEELERHPT